MSGPVGSAGGAAQRGLAATPDVVPSPRPYFFRLEGPGRERVEVTASSLASARVKAVRYLGSYLQEHPGFADEGHWRMLVEDEAGKVYFHLIVATVFDRERRGGPS